MGAGRFGIDGGLGIIDAAPSAGPAMLDAAPSAGPAMLDAASGPGSDAAPGSDVPGDGAGIRDEFGAGVVASGRPLSDVPPDPGASVVAGVPVALEAPPVDPVAVAPPVSGCGVAAV
jgi:hypothetical protein